MEGIWDVLTLRSHVEDELAMPEELRLGGPAAEFAASDSHVLTGLRSYAAGRFILPHCEGLDV